MGNTNEQKAIENERGLVQITAANVKEDDMENRTILSEIDTDGKKK